MHHENDKTPSCFSNLFSQSEQLKIKLVGVALQSIRVPGGPQSTRHAFVFIIYFILPTLLVQLVQFCLLSVFRWVLSSYAAARMLVPIYLADLLNQMIGDLVSPCFNVWIPGGALIR